MTKPVYRSPEEVYDLWADVLESGDYLQAKEALKRSDGFCCLGVLCDLAIKDGSHMSWDYSNYGTPGVICSAGFYTELPPAFLCDYLGLSIFSPKIEESAALGSEAKAIDLAEMNDEGKTFKEIAKHIREVIKPKALAYLKKEGKI